MIREAGFFTDAYGNTGAGRPKADRDARGEPTTSLVTV